MVIRRLRHRYEPVINVLLNDMRLLTGQHNSASTSVIYVPRYDLGSGHWVRVKYLADAVPT